ncbi:PTS sugar transporter subunit IIC [Deferribacter desulfuricans]|nr:PTS sugar transporter subunit IIC [Deferribacter desulfuricans]
MKYFLMLLISGLISVDRNSALNLMISRPIFIAMFIGLLFGNFYTIFLVGILFELIGLIDLPVGTHIPRDDSFMTYVACLVLTYINVDNVYKLFILITLVIIFSFPVTFTDLIVRKINQNIYLKNRVKGYNFPISKVISWGVILSFFRGVIIYNAIFFLVYYIYTQIVSINIKFSFDKDLNSFLILIICFASGYLIRFLSFKSVVKYLIFTLGIIMGWFLI